MPDQPPSTIPPIQLNYQPAPRPETPDHVTVFALDPLALPAYRLRLVLLHASIALIVAPMFLLVMWIIGTWQESPLVALIGAATWAAIAAVIRAARAWYDITRVWPSFRVTMDDSTLTRTSVRRKTISIPLAQLHIAQQTFFGGLALRQKNGPLLVIPRELAGWETFESRIQQHLPIQPARLSFKLLLQLSLAILVPLLLFPPAIAIWFITDPTEIRILSTVGTIATILFATYLLRSKNLYLSRKIRVAIICLLFLASHATRLLLPHTHF